MTPFIEVHGIVLKYSGTRLWKERRRRREFPRPANFHRSVSSRGIPQRTPPAAIFLNPAWVPGDAALRGSRSAKNHRRSRGAES